MGDGRVEDEKESDENWLEMIKRDWDLGEFAVQVN
jgi:hypothetical protein